MWGMEYFQCTKEKETLTLSHNIFFYPCHFFGKLFFFKSLKKKKRIGFIKHLSFFILIHCANNLDLWRGKGTLMSVCVWERKKGREGNRTMAWMSCGWNGMDDPPSIPSSAGWVRRRDDKWGKVRRWDVCGCAINNPPPLPLPILRHLPLQYSSFSKANPTEKRKRSHYHHPASQFSCQNRYKIFGEICAKTKVNRDFCFTKK